MSAFSFDPLSYPYASKRVVTLANSGMVAASQPLASQAGLDMMKRGGNAVDAAIATAAALTVLEPTSNGIGGDAFALVWTKGELHGLNASGPAPQAITIDKVKKRGYTQMPKYGWIPVTVPGAPAAWAELSNQFGSLSLTETLTPAIEYATYGYPVSPTVGISWKNEWKKYKKDLQKEEFRHWFETFAPEGRPPEIGETWKSPDHAGTLQAISESGATTFYKGKIADKIAEFSHHYDGFLTKEDMATYWPDWVDPISVRYRDYDVWEMPPNGQGVITLSALQNLKLFDDNEVDETGFYHRQIEALKLAFTDGMEYISEKKYMSRTVKDLLSEEYAQKRAEKIGEMAQTARPGTTPKGGTVYFATADGDGNMVSFIQSNYKAFGSGLVVPGTGIALQNRGQNFSLDPHHDNALQGGKKTYHTIIPGFITKDNHSVGAFGVMGGFMQPQGHLQVVMNLLYFQMNPQTALDAPRWKWEKDKKVSIESHFSETLAESLIKKGHHIRWEQEKEPFGRGQIILKDNETGTLYGGTESRTDGSIASF